ncbi:N-acetylneuraminate synthase [Bacteroides sp.]
MHTIIIAEAGVNHNGSMELAKKLVDVASDAGVDYVKFQTYQTEKLVSHLAKKASYQQRNLRDNDDSQYSMLKKLELSQEEHIELIEYCNSKNIKFFSTAFDMDSLHFLATLKLGLWKIPSGEITNYPYLKFVAEQKESVILSTGMSTLVEVEDAISVLTKYGTKREQITVLHCNTEYPTPMCDVNLKAMNTLGEKFGVSIGYSDHTQGIEVPVAAVTLGATIIEKHFTLDCQMDGPDHKASLEPKELKTMVTCIRHIEQALGCKDKLVSSSELKNKAVARKSIVAARDIEKGEVLSEDNLTVKRPGNGISPMQWESVIGTKACRSFSADDLIEMA